MKDKKEWGVSTRAVHAGVEPGPKYNSVNPPIYLSSTFLHQSPGQYFEDYEYSRGANPNRNAFEDSLSSLENAKHCFAVSSGVAAADIILRTLEPGDEIISGDDLYGGTYRLFAKLCEPAGIKVNYLDLNNSDLLSRSITDKTRMVWLESPTNPMLKIFDITKISEIVRAREGIELVVDNTFASPILQNPLVLGATVVMHSTTKYIGGHSDLLGGAVLTNSDSLASKYKFFQSACGAVPSPFDCYLMSRSLKTLPLRIERHCQNAMEISRHLEGISGVRKVIYPGLESHPGHQLAEEQMKSFGGMITLDLESDESGAKKFCSELELFGLAVSLGGVESLVEHPATMTHWGIPRKQRIKTGITDSLVRLSIGIENTSDLIEDLKQALDSIAG